MRHHRACVKAATKRLKIKEIAQIGGVASNVIIGAAGKWRRHADNRINACWHRPGRLLHRGIASGEYHRARNKRREH